MIVRTLLTHTLAMAWLLAAGPAAAADAVTFQLSFLPQGSDAAVYVGVQKGLYAAEHLDVTIIAGRGSTDTLSKIATGVIDLGFVSFDIFLASKSSGTVPATAVMAFLTKPPDSLLVATSSGITRLKDVVGRKVGTPPFSSSNLAWPIMLAQNGIDPASVTLLKADPNTLPGLLATGQIDAINGWATTAPSLQPVLAAAGKTMMVIPWSNSGYEGYSLTVVASDKTLAERPEVVRRFLKVTRQAIAIVYENTDRAAEMVKAMVPQAELAVFKAQIEATKPYLLNEITDREGVGIFAPARVKKSWDWVSKANSFPPDKFDPLTAIDTRFLGS